MSKHRPALRDAVVGDSVPKGRCDSMVAAMMRSLNSSSLPCQALTLEDHVMEKHWDLAE